MLITIPDLLTTEQVADARAALDAADWRDGLATAGATAARVKRNRQLDAAHPVARALGETILTALAGHPEFLAAALPLRILPPMFNRYEGGEHYGAHVDNAIRNIPGTGLRLRTDLSMTVFFSDPAEYDGGELRVIETYGDRAVKLPAGSAILYTATSLHEVTPVTRGARVASFFWIQSLIRDDTRRQMMYDLDRTIRALAEDAPDHAAVNALTGHYHKLLQQWSEL